MNVLLYIKGDTFGISHIDIHENSIKSTIINFTEAELTNQLLNKSIHIENIELCNEILRVYGAKQKYQNIDKLNIIILFKKNNTFICLDQFNNLMKLSMNELLYRKILNAKIINNKVVPFKGTFNLNEEDIVNGKEKIQRWSDTYVRANSGRNTGVCEPRGSQSSNQVQKQGTIRLSGGYAGNSLEGGSEKRDDTLRLLLSPRPVNGSEFHHYLNKFKQLNKNSAAVDLHTAAEYDNMQCLLYDNGKAGVAVEKSGNIVSVFKIPESNIKGFTSIAIKEAINNGGTKLDCYATGNKLPNLYMKSGMRPVCKIKFNREFAPDGWNFERDGEPDIVFMIKGSNIHEKYGDYTDKEVPYIYDSDTEDAYTRASKFRDEFYQREAKEKLNKSKSYKDMFNAFRRK